jgi:outer membrane murein-binding lipoprotein Lpp
MCALVALLLLAGCNKRAGFDKEHNEAKEILGETDENVDKITQDMKDMGMTEQERIKSYKLLREASDATGYRP